MYKKIILATLLVLPFLAVAQSIPDWWDATSRQARYPHGMWYSGISIVERQTGESVEDAFTRAKNEARVEAASSIRMFVEKEMSNNSRSVMLQSSNDFNEQITEVFESYTRTSVSMEIPGLKVESWQNPQTNEIAAFAFVSKNELQRKTEKQITVTLTKIEMTLESVKSMIERGDKMKARETAKNALLLFDEVEQMQKILLAISDNTDALQTEECNSLKQEMLSLCSSLSHGIRIYVDCDARLGESNYPTLKKEICASLSKLGCEFVSDASIADWAIYVEAVTRDYAQASIGGVDSFTSYVDATVYVDKMATSQRIFEDELHQKGTHTHNYREAARSAYKDVSNSIAKEITKVIEQ